MTNAPGIVSFWTIFERLLFANFVMQVYPHVPELDSDEESPPPLKRSKLHLYFGKVNENKIQQQQPMPKLEDRIFRYKHSIHWIYFDEDHKPKLHVDLYTWISNIQIDFLIESIFSFVQGKNELLPNE